MPEKDPHCARCASQMYRAHVRRQVDGRRSWIPVGWWCPMCGEYINE